MAFAAISNNIIINVMRRKSQNLKREFLNEVEASLASNNK